MAEITEPPIPATDTLQKSQEDEPVPDFDPQTMRKTKPGLKRLILTVSVLFSFILGVPLIYKSVEIYRAPLPFQEIESLSAEIDSNPILFPCRFRAIFIGFDRKSSTSSLESSILSRMTKLTRQTPQWGTNHTVSVVMDSDIGAVDFHGNDEAVDEALEAIIGGSGSGLGSGGEVYTVVVVVNGEEVRAVVGKYRHAWIIGRVLEAEAVSKAAEVFVNVFVNGGKEEGSIHGEFMPVGADGTVVLSFNLLNAEPGDWIYDWDFQTVDETLLTPIIEAMKSVANISVESQVLYHVPKSALSYWDDKSNSYIFSTTDLPFFVNSNEWHLDTSIAACGRSKMLQFVVYIPSEKECPLLLQLPDGQISKTNSFISPMWGGVIVLNPQTCRKDSESKHPTRHTILHKDLQMVFEVFMGQFRQLFGFKSENLYVGSSGIYNLLPSEKGFTIWELDVLSRMHTCFNLHSCATTLGSLSRLVQSLPRMIIKDEIGKQVKYSLEAAKLAQTNASLGVYDASAVSSRQARSLAEDAFFHPSIMSVSYYSFEHCFVVYSPFFLPVSMHVILAALREWTRYKKESKKYLVWKARIKDAS